MRKHLKNRNGQALVELALILPILLLLVFGITEFGRVFGTQLMLTHGAREGARAASVGATDSAITLIVSERSSAMIVDASKLVIDISPSESLRSRGDAVVVKVAYPVPIYAPIISSFMNNPYQVSTEVVMRVE